MIITTVWAVMILSCAAQEQLTCLRTNEVYDRVASHGSRETQQGPPGKQGPIGPQGSTGAKGSKGEPGMPDNSDITTLRGQISVLQTQLSNAIIALQLIEDGWFTPGNGYQYKKTDVAQNWELSIRACRQMRADLAVYGMKDADARRTIVRALSFRGWLGLHDNEVEGRWVWLDGSTSTNENTNWNIGEPNNGGWAENCAVLAGRVYDVGCNLRRIALCEKRLNV